jgi:trans-2-enoyl-CoA reductase
MLRAQYTTRGAVASASIAAVEFTPPPLAAGEALLAVLAAPINPSDLLTLTGEYGVLPPLPAVGGNEGVGKVVALGPGATGPAVGTTVLLPVGAGTWATHMIANAATLVPLPGNVDPVQLSMLTINPPSAFLMLRDYVKLGPGDWVIQNGANSAVGGYVNQLAKLKGYRTVSVVRREGAVASVASPDVVLVDGPNLAQRVAESTGSAQIHLGIDCIAGSATDRLASCLAGGGTLVSYGGMSREACQVSPWAFVYKDLRLRGFWLASWFGSSTPQDQMAVFGEIAQLVATGALSARVQATFDVREIKAAVTLAASGERDGKVVIVPRA